MQLVVPMAGAGRRFSDAGYTLPKPLVPVAGVPMVVRAVGDLPASDRQIFICHPEHVADHGIDATIKAHFPGCEVVVAPGLTAGQACSVRLAGELLNPAQPVLVGACDNTHLYDARRWLARTNDPSIDCLIWTYRHDPRVLVRPEAHGWVRADATGHVLQVSVKRPLSAVPLGDHAVSGCFWFRTARLMLAAIDQLVARDVRVNGEFYLDSVPNVLLDEHRDVRVFEVDKYIGWGTPEDLEDYQRWQRHFGVAGRAA